MRQLRAPRTSPHEIQSSRLIDLCAEAGQSRHDEQMFGVPTVPADPYTVWLEKREAEQLAQREADRRTLRQATSRAQLVRRSHVRTRAGHSVRATHPTPVTGRREIVTSIGGSRTA